MQYNTLSKGWVVICFLGMDVKDGEWLCREETGINGNVYFEEAVKNIMERKENKQSIDT